MIGLSSPRRDHFQPSQPRRFGEARVESRQLMAVIGGERQMQRVRRGELCREIAHEAFTKRAIVRVSRILYGPTISTFGK